MNLPIRIGEKGMAMSEDKMIGAIDAKYRKRAEKKRREWGHKEYKVNPDGSTQGYEEYEYPVSFENNSLYGKPETKYLKGVVRWWRK